MARKFSDHRKPFKKIKDLETVWWDSPSLRKGKSWTKIYELLTWLSTQITDLTKRNKELEKENEKLKEENRLLRLTPRKPKEPWEFEEDKEWPYKKDPYNPWDDRRPWREPKPWKFPWPRRGEPTLQITGNPDLNPYVTRDHSRYHDPAHRA